jgi:hypothetical protein
MRSPATVIRNQQRSWAASHGLRVDHSGYTLDLSDNLFAPLSEATRAEFSSGDGGELGGLDRRGKMQALHSSSALACNVFDYWRNRDRSLLAAALRLPSGIRGIEFERKFPTGLPGNPPNMDVVLSLDDGLIVAIESKFLEPYGSRHVQGFKDAYFRTKPGLWGRSGYSECQRLAFRLFSGETVFRWLHAEQLLKHILGLAAAKKPWELLYLWYEVPEPASEHRAEAEVFAGIARSDGIAFRSMSYQSLFVEMQAQAGGPENEYLAYLGERYFNTSAQNQCASS